MTTPTRYRLLKDLPDIPAGTEFVQIEEGYFRDYLAPAHAVDGDRIEEHDERCLIRSEHAANNPAWFQPIPDTPERPYPWEPFVGSGYWVTQEGERSVEKFYYQGTEEDHNLADIGCVYRTKEDAERRLNAEPRTDTEWLLVLPFLALSALYFAFLYALLTIVLPALLP